MFKSRHLFEEAPVSAGGYQGDPAQSATPPKPPTTPPAAKDETSGEVDDGTEFYKENSQRAPDKTGDPAAQSQQAKPPTDDAKVAEGTVAGYSEQEPAAQEEPKVDPPKPPDQKSIKEDLGFELDLKDVDEAVAKKTVDFAKANKLSEEATKAFLELNKKEFNDAKVAKDQAIKDYNKKVQETKIAWQKELKNDPVFGGENFAFNLGNARKMLEMMTETNKELTKSGNMLPPYVMRDLAAVYAKLTKTETLVQGDPVAEQGAKEDDHLSFYGKIS